MSTVVAPVGPAADAGMLASPPAVCSRVIRPATRSIGFVKLSCWPRCCENRMNEAPATRGRLVTVDGARHDTSGVLGCRHAQRFHAVGREAVRAGERRDHPGTRGADRVCHAMDAARHARHRRRSPRPCSCTRWSSSPTSRTRRAGARESGAPRRLPPPQAHARCLLQRQCVDTARNAGAEGDRGLRVVTDFCDRDTVEGLLRDRSDPRRLPAGRRVIHATAGTFWRPILLS